MDSEAEPTKDNDRHPVKNALTIEGLIFLIGMIALTVYAYFSAD